MSLYTKDSVEAAKEAVDMVELVGARTDLRPAGQGRFKGLCPFHEERTPSFSVNTDLKLYHCFGCGESGDAIRFLQETEALDFKAAIEMLAERYGVELKREEEDPRAEERRRRRERLMKLVERTATYYSRFLWDAGEAGEARAYLEGRGLGEEVLRAFRVGYAPGSGGVVVAAARRDGFDDDDIVASGVGAAGQGGVVRDRFRGRIMFPLADARGRVLGFGARALRDGQQPKYLNTSENDLYHKRRQLFGIDQARAAAAKARRIVAVEGYTDVLALSQAGVAESVGVMGVALPSEQLEGLSQAVGKDGTVYLALDADRAGVQAMLRAAQTAREREIELRVVSLPEGHDPADLVAAEGSDAFRALLHGALSVPEFQVRRVLADADLGTPRGRDRALEEVRPLVAALPERSAERDSVVALVADRLDVPAAYVTAAGRPLAGRAPVERSPRAGGAAAGGVAANRQEAEGESSRPAEDPGPGPPARGTPIDAAYRAERAFLAMCVSRPESGRRYLERAVDEHISSEPMRRVRAHLAAGHLDQPMTGLPADDPELAAHVSEVVTLAEEEPSDEAMVRLGFLALELRRIQRDLRAARQDEDYSRQRDLWAMRDTVRQELNEVMGAAG